jgi:hypothetical protein
MRWRRVPVIQRLLHLTGKRRCWQPAPNPVQRPRRIRGGRPWPVILKRSLSSRRPISTGRRATSQLPETTAACPGTARQPAKPPELERDLCVVIRFSAGELSSGRDAFAFERLESCGSVVRADVSHIGVEQDGAACGGPNSSRRRTWRSQHRRAQDARGLLPATDRWGQRPTPIAARRPLSANTGWVSQSSC